MPFEIQDVNSGISSAPAPANTPDATPISSPAQDANPPSSSGPDANTSAPSTENQSTETRADLLSVMKSAVEEFHKPDDKAPKDPNATSTDTSADPKSPDTTPKAQDPAPDPNAAKIDPADIPADELAKYSPNAQSRIRELIKANKELKSQYEVTAPVAQGFQQFQSYMAENRLEGEDVNLLMHVGSTLRRGDFKGFLNVVKPYVDAAEQALGVRIASDLQTKVEEGTLPEDDARELTRLRSERARMASTIQESQQLTQQQVAQQHVSNVQGAISNWEAGIAQRDPDYARKKDTVMTFAKALIQERGLPQSAAQAVAYAEEALRRVNDTFRSVRPNPQPTRQVPSGVQAATNGTPEPRSLMEAMKLGLERARAST